MEGILKICKKMMLKAGVAFLLVVTVEQRPAGGYVIPRNFNIYAQ